MEAGSASRYSQGRIRKSAVFFLWPGADRAHSVYVLDQALRNGGPHGVQYEVDAFAPGQLRRGYEISVTGHQNDLPNLPFQGEGRDVDAYSHVDPLLPYHWMDIFSRKIGKTTTPLQKIIKYARTGRPRIEVGQVAESQKKAPVSAVPRSVGGRTWRAGWIDSVTGTSA